MADPDVLAQIESLRREQHARDENVDKQLLKIHDLVNSQLTEAVNRFRDALKTIEELKAALGQQTGQGEGQAALATMEAKQGKDPTPAAPTPPAPDTPAPAEDTTRDALLAFIESTKAVAKTMLEQSEKMASLLIEKRTRSEAERQVERRRDRWRPA